MPSTIPPDSREPTQGTKDGVRSPGREEDEGGVEAHRRIDPGGGGGPGPTLAAGGAPPDLPSGAGGGSRLWTASAPSETDRRAWSSRSERVAGSLGAYRSSDEQE